VNLGAPVSLRSKTKRNVIHLAFFTSARAKKPDPFFTSFFLVRFKFSFQFVSRFHLAQHFSLFKSTPAHFGNKVGNGI
jgi:hypothetical protein